MDEPSPITVTCDKCGKEALVPFRHIGKIARCSCGNMMVVWEGQVGATEPQDRITLSPLGDDDSEVLTSEAEDRLSTSPQQHPRSYDPSPPDPGHQHMRRGRRTRAVLGVALLATAWLGIMAVVPRTVPVQVGTKTVCTGKDARCREPQGQRLPWALPVLHCSPSASACRTAAAAPPHVPKASAPRALPAASYPTGCA